MNYKKNIASKLRSLANKIDPLKSSISTFNLTPSPSADFSLKEAMDYEWSVYFDSQNEVLGIQTSHGRSIIKFNSWDPPYFRYGLASELLSYRNYLKTKSSDFEKKYNKHRGKA